MVGILIRNRIGMDIFGTNTRLERAELGDFEPGEEIEVEFELDCLLSRQEYTVTVAVQYWNGLSQDWLDDVLEFRVEDTKDVAGVLNLNTRVRHQKVRSRDQPNEDHASIDAMHSSPRYAKNIWTAGCFSIITSAIRSPTGF